MIIGIIENEQANGCNQDGGKGYPNLVKNLIKQAKLHFSSMIRFRETLVSFEINPMDPGFFWINWIVS